MDLEVVDNKQIQIERAEQFALNQFVHLVIDFGKRICIQLRKTVYGLGITDHHSAFVPFVLCYEHLSMPWAFRMFYTNLFISSVMNLESSALNRREGVEIGRTFGLKNGMRGGFIFAAATLHTFWSPARIGLRGPPVTKVVRRCFLKKSRPNITSAQRLSMTPNSRLYDSLKA